jgi:type II secretory pathway component PulF
MKKILLVGLVLALMLSVVPAMAETNSATNDSAPVAFQAMSNLSTVMPMTDIQLAAVEGAAVANIQIVINPQINVCAGVFPRCFQFNFSFISQRIGG